MDFPATRTISPPVTGIPSGSSSSTTVHQAGSGSNQPAPQAAVPGNPEVPAGHTLVEHANDLHAGRLQRNLSSYVTVDCVTTTALSATCLGATALGGLAIAGLAGHGPFALTAAQAAGNTCIPFCLGATGSVATAGASGAAVVVRAAQHFGRENRSTDPMTAPQQQTMVRGSPHIVVQHPDGDIHLAQSSHAESA
jgi:hypothetical protein